MADCAGCFNVTWSRLSFLMSGCWLRSQVSADCMAFAIESGGGLDEVGDHLTCAFHFSIVTSQFCITLLRPSPTRVIFWLLCAIASVEVKQQKVRISIFFILVCSCVTFIGFGTIGFVKWLIYTSVAALVVIFSQLFSNLWVFFSSSVQFAVTEIEGSFWSNRCY